jgi:hypothetical protein
MVHVAQGFRVHALWGSRSIYLEFRYMWHRGVRVHVAQGV